MAKTEENDLSLNWTRRVAIRHRILAVNIFAILLLGGGIFYLDSFRSRLTQARVDQARDVGHAVDCRSHTSTDNFFAHFPLRLSHRESWRSAPVTGQPRLLSGFPRTARSGDSPAFQPSVTPCQ